MNDVLSAPPTSHLATTLRRYRSELGLTQRELAAAAQVGVRTIQLLESGDVVRPRASTLRLLGRALVRAEHANRAARPYATDVTTDQNRDRSRAAGSTGAVPDAYAFPAAALATAPTSRTPPLVWLEPAEPTVVVTPLGTVAEPRVNVCRALPTAFSAESATRDEPSWAIGVLARDVRPLDGVELVNALRAFRGGGGDEGTL